MRYVDGFAIPVPKKNLKAYEKLAKIGKRLWLKHGALDYQECAHDEDMPDCGLPFGKALRVKRGETVVFSWIVYRSKAHRDAVTAKVMADPAMAAAAPKTMPFDMKRMAYGGFRVMVGK